MVVQSYPITAIQDEDRFDPGDCVVVWLESQPIHRLVLHYKSRAASGIKAVGPAVRRGVESSQASSRANDFSPWASAAEPAAG
ncbi:MAG: DUF3556 domain-containing protein [Mycobacterium sp.]